ncbi:MAG: VIT domain-containing protein, partial [Ferruginibacter sp.]
MNKTILSLLLLLAANNIIAQIPQLIVNGKTNNGVVLQKLAIEIRVCGTIAKTSWEMVFKNNTDRILEGTLNFPLKEGCAVSRYALDINGKMREAVPVDRGKGTIVFEAIERRRVDPGLLEKVEGNTFRTRIYPINQHSTRTVIIGYEEEIPMLENDLLHYYLPLGLKDTIADFSLNVQVIQSSTQPFFDSLAVNDQLHFDKRNQVYTAGLHKINYVPSRSLSFSIPKPADASEVVLQEFENKYYYLINTIVEKKECEKALPKNITLLWDASLSGTTRNIKMEMALMGVYFSKVKNVGITLVVFSNKVYSTRKYILENGNWVELQKAMDSIQYDGGTNLGSLRLKDIPGDEFLLVSDGHQTFGSTNIQLGNKPVYCINSAANADYSSLKYIALKTGGAVIDLQKDDLLTALNKLTMEPFRFLGIQKNEAVEESYPAIPVIVGNSFSMAGILMQQSTEIILQFGYGNTITLTKKITIDADKQLNDNFDVTKVFAQKKMAELDIQYEENKQAIESIGKRFGIVTRNTSLIVLETINDYIQYKIEPPAELLPEYNRIIKQRGREITLKE